MFLHPSCALFLFTQFSPFVLIISTVYSILRTPKLTLAPSLPALRDAVAKDVATKKAHSQYCKPVCLSSDLPQYGSAMFDAYDRNVFLSATAARNVPRDSIFFSRDYTENINNTTEPSFLHSPTNEQSPSSLTTVTSMESAEVGRSLPVFIKSSNHSSVISSFSMYIVSIYNGLI